MNRSEFTGSINEIQDAGKGKGERLVQGGARGYNYLCDCNKQFTSLKNLESHRYYECELYVDH